MFIVTVGTSKGKFMKKYLLPLVAAGLTASPALAVPSITFTTSIALPGYTTAQIFENFESQPGNGQTFAASYNAANAAAAGVTETGTANAQVFSASVPGIASDTGMAANTKFLSILGGASYSVNFTAPVQFFSFVVGSLDTYNEVKLTLTDNSVIDLVGAQIVNQPVTFTSTGNSSVAGRVSYDFGGGAGLKSAVFSSTNDSLEIDGLAAAVPEASVWAMMMVGLGVAGGALRRRRAASRVVFA